MTFKTLLISTYEMGRQPFGLASPMAWLEQAGLEVQGLDTSIDRLSRTAIQEASLIAFYLPMHMATRMAIPLIKRVQQINPQAHLCGFGLYAPVNEAYLRSLGVHTILGGEFESGLVALAEELAKNTPHPNPLPRGEGLGVRGDSLPLISLDRQDFLIPQRHTLPKLDQYAKLITADGQNRIVGYTEASRGCKHLCRHCPIVPVYNGRFRIIQPDIVLADIRQQIEAGAQHITFGDPDFLNGPGHAIPLVKALHQEFPDLTYDVTIKVEHLRQQRHQLETLKQTGCLFITSAVESFDSQILEYFDKQHTPTDLEAALADCRALELLIVPTFVAFTPWTTLAGYAHFLAEIARLGLVSQVAPIQYTLRLLIPPGSRLLELPQTQAIIGELDQAKLSYQWPHPDPKMDELQQDLERLVHRAMHENQPRPQIFEEIWERVQAQPDQATAIPISDWPVSQQFVPYLSEPWYC